MAAANRVIVSAQAAQRYQLRTGRAAYLALFALVLPLTLAAFVVPLPTVLAIGVLGTLLLPWFWREPIRGLYVLFAGALLIEIFPLGYQDSLTDRIPLFQNLNNSSGLQIPITPAELLLLAAILVFVGRAISTRTFRWPSGPLIRPYLAFLGVVLLAELNGLIAGGAFLLSLWELRPQVYGFLLFFLATCMVTDRRQLQRLAVIFAACVGLKGILGTFRYFVTLHRAVGSDGLLAHEESYFLGLFVVAVLVAMIWLPRRRRLLLPLVILLAPVVIALLANQRRVATFACAAGVAIVLVLAARFETRLRKRILWLGSLGAVAYLAFAIAFWNHSSGLTGQLIRPLRTAIGQSADPRDIASNLYRVAENINLTLSFHSAPILGMGFGRPFQVVVPMADITQYYPLWNVIPHDTLRWVGVRMGTVGYVAFWGLIAFAILQATNQLGRRRDPLLKAFAAFAAAAIVAELIVAYGDIQLENYRNMFFLGTVLGILNRMPEMQDA